MKKHYIKLLLSLFLISSFSYSCQKDNTIIEKAQESKQLKNTKSDEIEFLSKLSLQKKPQRSREEALKLAREIIKQNANNLRNLSSVGQKLEIDCIVKDKSNLRGLFGDNSKVADTTLYVVNIGDDNGFLIISGDKRTQDLLAITDKGSLRKGDTIPDNGFAVFLSRLPMYINNTVNQFEKNLDSLKRLAKGKNGLRGWEGDECSDHWGPYDCRDEKRRIYYEYGEWKDVKRSPILISVNWGQYSPYNDNAYVKDGQKCVSGCVSTALAMFLSKYKYPAEYDGVKIDWDLITRDVELRNNRRNVYTEDEYQKAITNVAQLFRKLGDHLGNDWGTKETGAYSNSIHPILYRMGYRSFNRGNEGDVDFDKNKTFSFIDNGNPVILLGCAKVEYYETGWWIFKKTKKRYYGGHAWVADGTLIQECEVVTHETDGYMADSVYDEIIDTSIETRTLLHCNWGWDGDCNGYFSPYVFTPDYPEPSKGRPVDAKNYQYNIKAIYYVKE